VFEENWAAVTMFLRLQTQWVIAGMGSAVGLNYQSVEFMFKLYADEVADPKAMFEDLREIELGALKAKNRVAKGAK
jgi:uncharacterized protein DUF1799